MRIKGGHEQIGVASLERANNLIHDLGEVREQLKSGTPSRSMLRSFSVMLRRLFSQKRELAAIVSPRIPDFKIAAPNFTPFHSVDLVNLVAFCGGGGNAFGIETTASMIKNGPLPVAVSSFKPGVLHDFSITDFLNHKVILWRRTWFNRKEVIEFVANVLGGAHTGVSGNKDRKLKDFTQNGSIFKDEETVVVSMGLPSIKFKEGPLILNPRQLDFLLFEISCYLSCLIASPDFERLESIIKAEVRDPSLKE